MKPKTRIQREIFALSAMLPPLTPTQEQWAYEHCFAKEAYQSKGRVWCGCCGYFTEAKQSDLCVDILGDTMICPSCGRKLTVKTSRRQKVALSSYYTVVTTCKGYQVCRNFIVDKYLHVGGQPFYNIHEVVQNWIAPDGHEEVVARPVKPLSMIYDAWDFFKPMEIRRAGRTGAYQPDKYHISGTWVYPRRNLLPIVKRNGYTGRNSTGIPESEHIRMLLTDPEAEMLEKTGQFNLFHYKYVNGVLPHKHAVRVANRNRYLVKDASMWIDYLGALEYFHLDTHNAHYVCPGNLKEEHDRLLKLKRRTEARKEAEERRRETAKWEAKYRADKAKYFGIRFGNSDILISVVQSVAEMAEEGAAMHHCVYNAGYHKKPYSLILSARDRSGNRIETIEVSLKTFKVVQSRAKCNGISEKHDEIVRLVQDNMYVILHTAKQK